MLDYYLLCDNCTTRRRLDPGDVFPMRCPNCNIEFDDVNLIRHPSQYLYVGIHNRLGAAKAAIIAFSAVAIAVGGYLLVRLLLVAWS